MLMIFFFLSLVTIVIGQVEHNYLVGPRHTGCDSLNIGGLPAGEALTAIENTIFRFDQKFKLSRAEGLRAGHFYSCDGISGFLIVTSGQEKVIHKEVPKKVWDEFISTSGLEEFYTKRIQGSYPGIVVEF